MSSIAIPHLWTPREYQAPLLGWFARGGKRGVAVWHRRAGKDDTALNLIAIEQSKRIGDYWHVYPEHKQARRAIWEGKDREGRRFIERAFPKPIVKGTNATDMRVDFRSGSAYYLVGSNNYNSLVGSNPVGVVFSEWSLCDPAVWDYIRPILVENGGWALFIYTPRGKNHGHKTYEIARKNPDRWFCSLLTVRDTRRQDGTPVMSEADIEGERADGMDDAEVEQEFYCSWTAAVKGAIWGKQMARVRKDGRVGRVPYQPGVPVHTFWDIGQSDSTSIWAMQRVGMQDRFVRYYEAAHQPIGHYIDKLNEWGFVYGRMYLPHDADHRRLGQGLNGLVESQTIAEMLRDASPHFRDIEIVPAPNTIVEGIAKTRDVFARCWFDEEGCERGLSALEAYQYDWDEKQQTWKPTPLHNWASHGADAFRQYGQTEFIPNTAAFSQSGIRKGDRFKRRRGAMAA